ncbi:hypothetical protein HAZT_HAZT000999 [Hyalella azteca]|uniref:Uncharacterized protein n=1 Tax=Hyalella azteca TaxID=294128 RepID=A0A6A0GVK0_HYAAZ|nr:hypothetical protein HAZT_HAZT000999 [Hyalella azteca]
MVAPDPAMTEISLEAVTMSQLQKTAPSEHGSPRENLGVKLYPGNVIKSAEAMLLNYWGDSSTPEKDRLYRDGRHFRFGRRMAKYEVPRFITRYSPGTSVMVTYVWHITFFGACLALSGYAEKKQMHSIVCLKVMAISQSRE